MRNDRPRGKGIVHSKELKVGQILKVTKGIKEKDNAKWIETGDYVKVLAIYPHVVLVEKTKSGTVGWKMRECFPLNSWELNLRIVS